ncbi:alpha-1,4-glucan--maltose-1-phosphate maltosyltransferase [Acidocella facilis]|uniref:alpha-1,4-glucan--maltose-1-phosphate maltosyltransferase n=1 Tax=Acidocella facilis TaxID=525 RepID=UPI001F1AC7FC|nr:alpha-1,4-glucan--maltose-1-phosphate maltosyltransferase [Acidocella facilis]
MDSHDVKPILSSLDLSEVSTASSRPFSLFCSGQQGDFEIAYDLGFTHALIDNGALINSVLKTGLVPIMRAQDTDAARMLGWLEEGVGGFYVEALSRLSAATVNMCLKDIKTYNKNVIFIADCFGASPQELKSYEAGEFAFANSSSCYWDFSSGWLNQDTNRIESIASALAHASPPGSRDWNGAAARRALRFSALFAPGWAADRTFLFQGDPDLLNETKDLLELRCKLDPMSTRRAARLISAPGGTPALLRRGDLVIGVNQSLDRAAAMPAAHILPYLDCALLQDSTGVGVTASGNITLAPGEVAHFIRQALSFSHVRAPILNTNAPRIAIESLAPSVDQGRFPTRRIIGELVKVSADLITDGHDKIAAELVYRAGPNEAWHSLAMNHSGNDSWQASFPLERLGQYEYFVQAWFDHFATFTDGLRKKIAARQNVTLELREGLALVDEAAAADTRLNSIAARCKGLDQLNLQECLLNPEFESTIQAALPRRFLSVSSIMKLDCEQAGARFASWYEIFPRSQSGDVTRHGTFTDVISQLPRIAAMGFDVVYFPPIHPIGKTNRKGPNNSLQAQASDPGSPYAIGDETGGHDALHPELGTLAEFKNLIAVADKHGLSIALDFAIQCSPDHPWLKTRKEWFDWRPDGSLRYAENPPKKYEDIVNVDFYAPGSIPDLWLALSDIVQFWVDQGIRYFRVDNPHTKPLPFWEWMIADIRSRHPDTIFLAEAFTRPKLMYRLAKIGFSQSYTYFTWRNEKQELISYMGELAHGPAKNFFRPHFFVNTPDINPIFLQRSGRGGFLIRAALAATLSGLFGVYNGFELCEAAPVLGKEEYLNSEKYEIKAWDYTRSGNIVVEITTLNMIRRETTALQSHLGIEFLQCENENVLYMRRYSEDGSFVLVVISLDPHHVQETLIEIPLWRVGLPDDGVVVVEDLTRSSSFFWYGKHQNISLDPHELPYSIWRLQPQRTET